MTSWSDAKWIKAEVLRRWESGRILRALLTQEDLFPLRLTLKKPSSSEVNQHFAQIAAWLNELREQSKTERGFGYELVEKEIRHRQSGRNSFFTHAIIPTMQDAIKLLKKEAEAARFLSLTERILKMQPELRPWLEKHPNKVLVYAEDWTGILAALDWFSEHPNCGLYLRQLDIKGIDTKFIEQRKGLLQELLDLVLPDTAIRAEGACFEQRYGLRTKPTLVRMRLLDKRHFVQSISDLTLPLEQFTQFSPLATKVFITENEINGLCFPDVSDSLVIFGLGYGVDMLKDVSWLREKEIYYWGDLDTHGFAMLDQVRSFLPQTKSMLMDETVLQEHRTLFSVEKKQFYGKLTRLTTEEAKVFYSLQNNVWGSGVRLEQERIAFTWVKRALGIDEIRTGKSDS